MSMKYVYASDYGQTIELTFIDADTDEAADISGYSDTVQMIFIDPDKSSMVKTASFKTDGSDGKIQYTIDQGLFSVGDWLVRGRVKSASAQLTTESKSFECK